MATFTNQATLTYNNTTTNSNITTGELLEVLSAAKTALTGSYGPGDLITYVVSIVNSGTTPFTGLTVSDNLGGYAFDAQTLYPLDYVSGSARYYINGALQAAPAVTAGPPLTITGLNVPAGGNAMLVYEARANQFAPLGNTGTINNVATISGGGLSTAVSADATVTAETDARLTISKSLCPATITENGQLTYTFVIQNTGSVPVDAAGGAFITDVFDPILEGLTVAFNNTPWAVGTNYTYDQTTGTFSSLAGQITVPAASYVQDPTTGLWSIQPGVSVLTVSGTV